VWRTRRPGEGRRCENEAEAALLGEQRLARDRTEAYHDARALALELARGQPFTRFDQMAAGVVLHTGETVYRQLRSGSGCWTPDAGPKRVTQTCLSQTFGCSAGSRRGHCSHSGGTASSDLRLISRPSTSSSTSVTVSRSTSRSTGCTGFRPRDRVRVRDGSDAHPSRLALVADEFLALPDVRASWSQE